MSYWTELRTPTECELLIGFYDLVGYTRYAENEAPEHLLLLMSGYFSLTGQLLSNAGGRLIKTMGDSGLAAFPKELADDGVKALRAVQHQGDAWLLKRGYRSRAVVKIHTGTVAVGFVGAPGEEIMDVYGSVVNTAATLPSKGFAMTPAAFRSLSVETRKLFKKHTPPVRYIALDDPHSTTD